MGWMAREEHLLLCFPGQCLPSVVMPAMWRRSCQVMAECGWYCCYLALSEYSCLASSR